MRNVACAPATDTHGPKYAGALSKAGTACRAHTITTQTHLCHTHKVSLALQYDNNHPCRARYPSPGHHSNCTPQPPDESSVTVSWLALRSCRKQLSIAAATKTPHNPSPAAIRQLASHSPGGPLGAAAASPLLPAAIAASPAAAFAAVRVWLELFLLPGKLLLLLPPAPPSPSPAPLGPAPAVDPPA